ncbi:MAG: hypothetical protein WHV26_11025 [Spirochaetota bacterium]
MLFPYQITTSFDTALVEGKYFPKPNDYDTEHDFYWYLQQDGSRRLPGMGGVFNAVNMDVYHYAGNNPVKLVDPDGKLNVHFITERRMEDKTKKIENRSIKNTITMIARILDKIIHYKILPDNKVPGDIIIDGAAKYNKDKQRIEGSIKIEYRLRVNF